MGELAPLEPLVEPGVLGLFAPGRITGPEDGVATRRISPNAPPPARLGRLRPRMSTLFSEDKDWIDGIDGARRAVEEVTSSSALRPRGSISLTITAASPTMSFMPTFGGFQKGGAAKFGIASQMAARTPALWQEKKTPHSRTLGPFRPVWLAA